MSGELWLSQFQIGLESTPGTLVPATLKSYYAPDSVLTRERDPRPHKFATGTRDNTRSFSLGPTIVGGSVSQPLSASELVELLLLGIKGGVTPTVPFAGVYLWTFVPGASALASASLEWYDGARGWAAAGVRVNSLNFAGSANGEHMVTAELFGQSMVAQAITGALTSRVPDLIEGWETKLYIEAVGGTPGTTNIPGTLISWDVTFNNNLGRKYFADNTNAAGGISVGEMEVTASLVFEAAPSTTLTEYTNWDSAVSRLVRLEFGQNVVIASTLKRFVTLDIPGAWSAFELGSDDEGTRTYSLELNYVYNVAQAYGLQVRTQNARPTAWV